MGNVINSKSQFDNLLKSYGKQVCDFATEELYNSINYFINQYYNEYSPEVYRRTEQFLRSAFKTSPKIVGNKIIAEVGIDYESLSYVAASGLQVVEWANEETHGGRFVNTHTKVWDDAIDSTINSGQLLMDCVTFLKTKGFTIS